jgi:hypothetical protein
MSERLSGRDLLELVQQWAQQPQRWESLLRWSDSERWSGLLHCEAAFDVWLLSWPVQTATQLHDHGDSAGAFEVVSGQLEELYLRRRLRRRQLPAGARVSFPAGAVHDVLNSGSGPGDQPAVSLHAYSPPLTSMTFYENVGGRLAAVRSEPVIAPPLLTLPTSDTALVGSAR